MLAAASSSSPASSSSSPPRRPRPVDCSSYSLVVSANGTFPWNPLESLEERRGRGIFSLGSQTLIGGSFLSIASCDALQVLMKYSSQPVGSRKKNWWVLSRSTSSSIIGGFLCVCVFPGSLLVFFLFFFFIGSHSSFVVFSEKCSPQSEYKQGRWCHPMVIDNSGRRR